MSDVFPIVPAAGRATWFLAVVGLVLAAGTLLIAWLAWSARHSRVEVDATRVRLVGDLWGRSIPLSALDVAQARVVDLERTSELQPRSRRLGTGLPGYAAGWFRLANGEKALVYLTRSSPVVYVPTREDYALLLSVSDPDAFLARIGAGGRARPASERR
jgi:hypothetical protein